MQIEISYINSTRKKWKLLKECNVCLSNGVWVIIPKDFIWDLSSVPRFFWSIFPPFGDFLVAALVHDYLYHCNKNKIFLMQNLTREFADKEMLYFSNKFNKNKIDNYIRFLAVRAFGQKKWIK